MKKNNNQWKLFSVVLVLAILLAFYYVLRNNELDSTAALYVGLPLLLALGTCLTPNAKSVTGAAMKILTIGLLLSAPVLNEGYICIILAAPILYSVVALILLPVDIARKKKKNAGKVQLAFASVLVSVLSLEGTSDELSFNRSHAAEYTMVVPLSQEEFLENFSHENQVDEKVSFWLNIFPKPVTIEGSGINVGDERRLHYVYNKWLYLNAHEGSATFRVVESKPGYLKFSIPHDTSYLRHYLGWESSEFFLTPISGNETLVRCNLSYTRKLDPVWYFGPLQYGAVRMTAKTLIEQVAYAGKNIK